MMGFMIYFVINMRFLRFLRFFEKWSELGKIRKNQEKWGKKPGAESPYIHYSSQCNQISSELGVLTVSS